MPSGRHALQQFILCHDIDPLCISPHSIPPGRTALQVVSTLHTIRLAHSITVSTYQIEPLYSSIHSTLGVPAVQYFPLYHQVNPLCSSVHSLYRQVDPLYRHNLVFPWPNHTVISVFRECAYGEPEITFTHLRIFTLYALLKKSEFSRNMFCFTCVNLTIIMD